MSPFSNPKSEKGGGVGDMHLILEKSCQNLQEEFSEIKVNIKEENIDMKIRLEKLEQYSRRNNLHISGIPLKENEKVKELVKNLGAKMQVPIKNLDIVAAHRLPTKSSAPPIIVRFTNRDTKTEMINASRKMKLNGEEFNYSPALPIYCEERLTQYTQNLLTTAKKLRQEGYIKYVRVREGIVRVRVEDSSPAIKIEHLSQLEPSQEHTKKDDGGATEPEINSPGSKNINLNLERTFNSQGPNKNSTINKQTIEERGPEAESGKTKEAMLHQQNKVPKVSGNAFSTRSTQMELQFPLQLRMTRK